MDPQAAALQYNKYIKQRTHSPTRQTAVKFLMTSPENPFGEAKDQEYGQEELQMADRFELARRNTYSGAKMRQDNTASSPESGLKVSMYSNLQNEIRDEARRKSALDPQGSSFQFVLGARSSSPTKNYDFAEKAPSALAKIGGETPERNARPIKKVNPYDCFRSGEARESIVQAVKETEKKVITQAQNALANTRQSPNGKQYPQETKAKQVIQPYRKYKPEQPGRHSHAVPNQEPDPVEHRFDPSKSVSKPVIKKLDMSQVHGGHQAPQGSALLGPAMLEKHLSAQVATQPESQIAWPSAQPIGQIQNPLPRSREPYHKSVFKPLRPQNTADQAELMNFYKEKYHLKDLSKVKITPQQQARQQPALYPRQDVATPTQIDELRHVNPQIVKEFGLGSLQSIQLKMHSVMSHEQMVLQYQTQSLSVGQPLIGQKLSLQEMQQAARMHGAALCIQRHMRGQIVRKRLNTDAFLFFKKVQRIANVRSLVYAMKNAYISIKNTKQKYLKKYIFWAATRIQSLFRGYRARKIKVPIRRKIQGKRDVLEAAALGWKTRRILKVREVQGRIQQVRDYENAEEETLVEAKRTKSLEERQKLLTLIDGFRLSRQTTVEKLINLIDKLFQRSLWLTYVTAEQAEEGFRTPRKSGSDNFLKRNARTANRQQPPFLLSVQTTTPLTPMRNLKHGTVAQSTVYQSLELKAIPEQRRMTTVMSTQNDQEEKKVSKLTSSQVTKSFDRKFTISHNNRVEPNFHSQSYQQEAKESFKKRMQYNPMESAKKNRGVNLEKVTSEYAQQRVPQQSHADFNQVIRQVEQRIDQSLGHQRKQSGSQSALSRSVDQYFRGSRENSRLNSRELPVAKSQYVIDGEILTFSRYKEDQHITRESRMVQKRKSSTSQKYRVPQTQSSRPNTPPREPEESKAVSHVKVSALTNSFSNGPDQRSPSAAAKYSFNLPSRQISVSPTRSHDSGFKINPVPAELPAAGKPTVASAQSHTPKKYDFSGSALPKTSQTISALNESNAGKTDVGLKQPTPLKSDLRSSLFGSIEPKNLAKEEEEVNVSSKDLIGLQHFEKSSKDFRQNPAKFTRQNPESPRPTGDNEDLQKEIPKFEFTSKPKVEESPGDILLAREPSSFTKFANEILAHKKPDEAITPLSPSPVMPRVPVSQKPLVPVGQVEYSVRNTRTMVADSANELLAMLQKRTTPTIVRPKTPSSKSPQAKPIQASKVSATANKPTAPKQSIFASALQSRNSMQHQKSKEELSMLYQSNQSVAQSTVTFGMSQKSEKKSQSAAKMAGIKPYQSNRRKRDERKKAPAANNEPPLMDIDRDISMFGSPEKGRQAVVQPVNYTPEVQTTSKKAKRPKSSTTTGLFRKGLSSAKK